MDGLKERLRALRESRGYSQKGLAKRLGCSPSLISSYKTGERSPLFLIFAVTGEDCWTKQWRLPISSCPKVP